MRILSLFDGISCGYLAFQNLGIEARYYASEIDKYAIQISQKNHKDTIHLGDILDWESWKLPEIDMIIGGSPCQGFSNAGKGLNFEDERSRLFFTFVDILKKYKPKYFILENVKMKKKRENIISEYLGITPVLINSSLVSAQNRERLYWVGERQEDGEYKKINIPIPEDRNIFLKDILEKYVDRKYYKNFNDLIIDRSEGFLKIKNATKKGYILAYDGDGVDLSFPNSSTKRGRVKKGKSGTLTTYPFQGVIEQDRIRQLTPIEYERLQTLPDNYTEGVSDNQRYKMIGNAWTVEVIMHIINFIFYEDNK